jgi:hypothetical protein
MSSLLVSLGDLSQSLPAFGSNAIALLVFDEKVRTEFLLTMDDI